jgi:hypothetical protein
MDIDYYAKYLKYKNKYIELKKQMGGVQDIINKDTICNLITTQSNCTNKKGCHWNGTTCKNNMCKFNNGKLRTEPDCNKILPITSCEWKMGPKGKTEFCLPYS